MSRALLIVVALAGCASSDDTAQSQSCLEDTDCSSGSICSGAETCEPAGDVRTLHVLWTVSGQPASASTCTNSADLDVWVENPDDPSDAFDYYPVPCAEGELTLLEMPTRYMDVAISVYYGVDAFGPLDGSGVALLDLPY
jgi:hypothetical protein